MNIDRKLFKMLPENVHNAIKKDYEYLLSGEREKMQFYCLSKGRFVNTCFQCEPNTGKIVDIYDIAWGMGGHTMITFDTETMKYSYSGLRNVGTEGCEKFIYSTTLWSDMYSHIVTYLADHIPKKDYNEDNYNKINNCS